MSEALTAEIKAALEASDQKLSIKFEEYEKSLKAQGDVSESVKADLKAMSEENVQLGKQLKSLQDELVEVQQKRSKFDKPGEIKTMGQQAIESEAFKAYCEGKQAKFRMEFKNTIIGEGGSPQNPTDTIVPRQDMPGIVAGAFRPLRVMDIVPQGTTGSNTIHFTRELAWTNNAAETSEAAQKPESVLTFEAVDCPVRTIPHFIKVSKQVLDDAPQLQSYIDRRMRYGVNFRLEQQVINGNGTSPNLSGILDSGNHTELTANSGENNFDFANRMKYSVISGEYMTDYFMVNPADWGLMERIKVGTGDDRYVGADGAINYLANGLQPTLWGVPVIASNSVPEGKLLAVSSDALMFWSRQGTAVEIFDQNEDDVEKNLLTIRAEMRGAFCVFRPAAVYAGDLPQTNAE